MVLKRLSQHFKKDDLIYTTPLLCHLHLLSLSVHSHSFLLTCLLPFSLTRFLYLYFLSFCCSPTPFPSEKRKWVHIGDAANENVFKPRIRLVFLHVHVSKTNILEHARAPVSTTDALTHVQHMQWAVLVFHGKAIYKLCNYHILLAGFSDCVREDISSKRLSFSIFEVCFQVQIPCKHGITLHKSDECVCCLFLDDWKRTTLHRSRQEHSQIWKNYGECKYTCVFCL